MSQVLVPVQVSASSPLMTDTHVPPPPVQAWQVLQELTMKQRWSTQLPVEQSVFTEQTCPGLLRQLPPASQVLAVVQVSGSSMPVTVTQVPLAPVQLWQVPHAATPQQRPSMQWPDMHMVPSPVHMAPAPSFVWQAPAELQNCVEGQGAVVLLQAPAHTMPPVAHRLLMHVVLCPARQPPW